MRLSDHSLYAPYIDALTAADGDPQALAQLFSVQALAGDASSRSYFRIASGHSSAIVMRLPAGAIPIEEGFTGRQAKQPDYPFLSVGTLLDRYDIPVVKVFHADLGRRFLLLEDLGDVQVWNVAEQDLQSPDCIAAYEESVEILSTLQVRCTAPFAAASPPSFNAELFAWEFEHFIDYGLFQHQSFQGEARFAVDAKALTELRTRFSAIAVELAALPQVICHRDYHSKNLMVHKGTIRIIDFQDALLGPATYDLASLLRDSYTSMPAAMQERFLETYLKLADLGTLSSKAFQRLFHLTGLQRNCKAWGRFIFIDRVKGKPHYLPFIPNTIRHIVANAEFYPEIHALLKVLSAEYRSACP